MVKTKQNTSQQFRNRRYYGLNYDPYNFCVEVLTTSVTVFGDRAFKETTEVK